MDEQRRQRVCHRHDDHSEARPGVHLINRLIFAVFQLLTCFPVPTLFGVGTQGADVAMPC